MAHIVKAASATGFVQAHRRKRVAAESGAHNEIRKGRKPKLADPMMPAAAPVPGGAAAAPVQRPARLSKALDQPVSNAKKSKPARAPQRRKPPFPAPAAEPFAARVATPPGHAVEPRQASAAAPAAQWDHATDTIRLDWTAIEQMASRDGPHQGTAKLLIAARARGANSRWPL